MLSTNKASAPNFRHEYSPAVHFFSPVDALWINRQQMAACQTSPEFVYRRLRPSPCSKAKAAKNFAGSTRYMYRAHRPFFRCIQSSIPTDSVYRINGAAKKGAEKGKLFRPHLRAEKRKKAHRQVALARNLLFSGRWECCCMLYVYTSRTIHVRRAEHN